MLNTVTPDTRVPILFLEPLTNEDTLVFVAVYTITITVARTLVYNLLERRIGSLVLSFCVCVCRYNHKYKKESIGNVILRK